MKYFIKILFITVLFHPLAQDDYPAKMKRAVSEKINFYQSLNVEEKLCFIEKIDSIFEPLKGNNDVLYPVSYFVIKGVLSCDTISKQLMINLLKDRFHDCHYTLSVHRKSFMKEYKNLDEIKPGDVKILLEIFDCISMCKNCSSLNKVFCLPEYCSSEEKEYRKKMLKILGG